MKFNLPKERHTLFRSSIHDELLFKNICCIFKRHLIFIIDWSILITIGYIFILNVMDRYTNSIWKYIYSSIKMVRIKIYVKCTINLLKLKYRISFLLLTISSSRIWKKKKFGCKDSNIWKKKININYQSIFQQSPFQNKSKEHIKNECL